MKKYLDQVKQINQKPEHVRHRIALATSVGLTALVGIIWLVGSATNGKFSLSNGNVGTPADQSAKFSDTKTNVSNLIGSVGAAVGTSPAQPSLTIVDGGTSSTIGPSANAPTPPSDATAIPF